MDDLTVDGLEDPHLFADAYALARRHCLGTFFTVTPVSSTICSGWVLDPSHRIASMIRAGLRVTIATDDAMFFRTDIWREYREGLTALGGAAERSRPASPSRVWRRRRRPRGGLSWGACHRWLSMARTVPRAPAPAA